MVDFAFEREGQKRGFMRIAGVDEAGRGPLAGPVVAAACILPPDFALDGVDDSKKITPEKREFLFEKLVRTPNLFFAICSVDAQAIDEMNIRQATLLAMRRALLRLPRRPDLVLVDGKDKPSIEIPCETIIGGDGKSFSIACASILAKVARDAIMRRFHSLYPDYQFDRHKGYPTAKHRALLARGLSPIHRRSFSCD
jgi:ribonuclease HII